MHTIKVRKTKLSLMETQEIISSTTSSLPPILPRLDRVDRLLQFLEERHSSNWERLENENKSVSMSSAMEKVHYKGTVMERLAVLENQVLQLWLALEDHHHCRRCHHHVEVDQSERSTMNSGSSSVSASTLESDHPHVVLVHQSTGVGRMSIEGKGKHRRRKNTNHLTKWLRWFPTGY